MHDLISLSEQFPGLTVSVKLEDLLTAGRTLSAELIDSLAQTREEAPVSPIKEDELLTKGRDLPQAWRLRHHTVALVTKRLPLSR